MKRWHCFKDREVESKDIDNFLTELFSLCKKHNISISHEDDHGAFRFEKFSEDNWAWLERGDDAREETDS